MTRSEERRFMLLSGEAVVLLSDESPAPRRGVLASERAWGTPFELLEIAGRSWQTHAAATPAEWRAFAVEIGAGPIDQEPPAWASHFYRLREMVT